MITLYPLPESKGGLRRIAGERVLLLATDAAGTARLSRFDFRSRKARLLWQRPTLGKGTSIRVALLLPGERLALLTAKGKRVEYRTIREGDGRPQGGPISVAPDTSDLVLVAGVPALATSEGLVPVRPSLGVANRPSDALNSSFEFAGALSRGSVAYAYATSGAADLSSGNLLAYTVAKGHLSQTYRSDFAPGASDLVRSGDRLIASLTDGQIQVYNVADPGHPRLAGQFYRNKDWMALATSSNAGWFYAMERDGTLRAYRWDDRKGIVAASNAVPGQPADRLRLFAYPGGVAACGDDGTVRLYRMAGSKLAKAADLKLGTGPVLVLN